jgi:hypothetical protein
MDILDLSWNDNQSKRHNIPLLPRSIRGLIIGKSGCGKTTVLINLLLRPGWLDYNNLQVFGKSLFQPEYKIIKKGFEEGLTKESLLNLFKIQDEIMKLQLSPDLVIEEMKKDPQSNASCKQSERIESKFFENSDEVPDPRELNAEKKNLMIFDDLQLEKQNKCESYYIRGRHSNVDSFYLAQNYFKLPRQTIRENANFICLFKQDLKNVNHIYDDHVSTDMPKDEFRKLCKVAWQRPHGFLVIDLTSKKNYGKYRCGFDEFYIPEECHSNYATMKELLPHSE